MSGSALAVALAVGSIGWRPIVVVNAERGTVPGSLFDHLCDLSVGHIETMLNGIAAAIQRALQADSAISVAGYFLSPAVGLIHNCPEFFHGERRLRDQFTIFAGPGAMRHVDLNPVGAVIELLAGGLAGLHRAVNDLHSFGHGEFGRIAFEGISARG